MESEIKSWLYMLQHKKSFESFFIKNNIKTIAIYGCAYLGDRFYSEVLRYGIEVKYFIDKLITQFRANTVTHPYQLSTVAGVDLVVICISEGNAKQAIKMVQAAKLPFITIMQLIRICFYKEVLMPYCENLKLSPLIFAIPPPHTLSGLSPFEKALSSAHWSPDHWRDNPSYLVDINQPETEYNDEYLYAVYTASPVIRKENTIIHSDISSKYVNVIQGIRITDQVPTLFSKSIHMIGHCVTFGYGVDDARTIESYLQRKINRHYSGGGIRVVNHGVWGLLVWDPMLLLDKIKTLKFRECDIVIFIINYFPEHNDPFNTSALINVLNENKNYYFSLYDLFCEPRPQPLYLDSRHLSTIGGEKTAEYIISILESEDVLSCEGTEPVSLIEEENNEAQRFSPISDISLILKDYISFLEQYKKENFFVNGAIVMNCNPFTHGHRYLIETASKQCDYLYVFVVEEDLSAFPFNDRLRLVRAGTCDLENVIVVPSGKLILSAITFPEYFVKESISDITVDTSKDIEIFARNIAPVMNIKKRFVGEEPLDPVTRQYNQTMKDIFPQYDIELIEFERHCIDSEAPISASTVRRLLETKRWNEIEKLVPKSTLQYLKKMKGHTN